MKISKTVRTNFKRTAMAVALTAAFGASYANAESTMNLNVQPAKIYQMTKGEELGNALSKIADRSGITFKVDESVTHDLVTQSVPADSWDAAVQSLLKNYNYSTVLENGKLKTVFISGQKGSGDGNVVTASKEVTTDSAKVVVFTQSRKPLPREYAEFEAGAVNTINVPTKELFSLKDGEDADLDLPIGNLSITKDQVIKQSDGSKIFIGHLKNEGQGYRVMISQGPAGIMGSINTPEGSFAIEKATTSNDLVLVDSSKTPTVGLEDDQAIPTPDQLAAMTNVAMTAEITQADVDALSLQLSVLETKVKTAQAAVDKQKPAFVLASANLASWNKYQTFPLKAKYDTAQANYDTALKNFREAMDKANAAFGTPSYASLVATAVSLSGTVGSTSGSLGAAKGKYEIALVTVLRYQAPIDVYNGLVVTLDKATTEYNNAKLALDQAKATLASAAAPASDMTTVDIMVLYTTQGWTAEFAKQRLNYLVAQSNQAYKDSGAKVQLRLVASESTTYTESNANATALSDLANGKGVFASVAAKRAAVGADLVYLFRPLRAMTAGSCGTTYIEMFNGGKPNKWLGFGTIMDGRSVDSNTSSYCSINTFTHEIGHSFGLVHDKEYSGSTSGANWYSYAWGVSGSFGTIMSYKQPSIMLFSTVSLSSCNYDVCGNPDGSTEQVMSINDNIAKIAAFNPTMIQ